MKKLIEKTSQFTRRGAVAMQLNRPEFRRQRGASAIEYVIIAAVIALAVFAGGQLGLTDAFTSFFTEVKDAVEGN